ncbi:hypothetical protein MIPYR_40045 [uncultured Microbacterium sp.]|uniref:Uncharacterized protein n=1 Tax=uncultured Microbacterium sp. TaxID=191216 RepID=A0A1Y5P3G3_9MICO|nr:hypothetical protein MIPYR_40045 [uncultured Microbacterium sp.]
MEAVTSDINFAGRCRALIAI